MIVECSHVQIMAKRFKLKTIEDKWSSGQFSKILETNTLETTIFDLLLTPWS